MNDCFASFVSHSKYSQLKRLILSKTKISIARLTSIQTRFKLMAGLKKSGVSLKDRGLSAFYFYGILLGTHIQKTRRERTRKAKAFRAYQLYLKHFYSIIRFATERFNKGQLKHKAASFWRFRATVKTLKGLVYNTIEARKQHNVRAFHHSSLCSKAFQALIQHYNKRQSRAAVKTRVMHLLQKKCVKIFRVAFATWRDRFHQRLYANEALVEFEQFREQRRLRLAFDHLDAYCKQQKQIRDMTRKAQSYFKKRRNFRTVYSVFHALYEYASMK